MARPAALEGITVLDLSTVGPGTRCTRILADFGARVVKVGAPPRKAGVQVEPLFYAYSARRGYEQVRLDLKAPEGKDAFLRLAKQADVVLESYRPGVVDRLGIGYADVRAVNPRIVYCSTSGFGQDGPASSWAGWTSSFRLTSTLPLYPPTAPSHRSPMLRSTTCPSLWATRRRSFPRDGRSRGPWPWKPTSPESV